MTAVTFPTVPDPRRVLIARSSAWNVLLDMDELDIDVAYGRLLDGVRDIEAFRNPPKPKWPKPLPTPQATIEAIMYCVRTRGIDALKQPDNVRRLRECDARAKDEINQRIAALKARKGVA